MYNLAKIIGLKVLSVKGEHNAKGKYIDPCYILFDDGKTYITFDEQDYYTYHDCSSSARHINISVSEQVWQLIFEYPDATTDL